MDFGGPESAFLIQRAHIPGMIDGAGDRDDLMVKVGVFPHYQASADACFNNKAVALRSESDPASNAKRKEFVRQQIVQVNRKMCS